MSDHDAPAVDGAATRPEGAALLTPRAGHIAVIVSMLAGVAVMVYVIADAGAGLSGVVGLLPVRLHLLALAAFAADIGGRAARVSLLARGVGHRVRATTALWAVLAGEGAGAVTPSKAGSAPAKVAVLTRDRMDVGTGSAVLVGETLAEAISLLPLALTALVLFPSGRTGAYAALGYAGLVVVAAIVLYRVARLPLRNAPRWWLRLGVGERRWRVLRVVARRFRHRSKALEHLSAPLLTGIALATLLHLAGRLALLPALAVGRVSGSAFGALVAWPFLLLYGGAMVPTPAGGGAVEAVFAAALASVLPAADLPGLLVWWRFYTFYLPAVLGGAVLVLGALLMKR